MRAGMCRRQAAELGPLSGRQPQLQLECHMCSISSLPPVQIHCTTQKLLRLSRQRLDKEDGPKCTWSELCPSSRSALYKGMQGEPRAKTGPSVKDSGAMLKMESVGMMQTEQDCEQALQACSSTFQSSPAHEAMTEALQVTSLAGNTTCCYRVPHTDSFYYC